MGHMCGQYSAKAAKLWDKNWKKKNSKRRMKIVEVQRSAYLRKNSVHSKGITLKVWRFLSLLMVPSYTRYVPEERKDYDLFNKTMLYWGLIPSYISSHISVWVLWNQSNNTAEHGLAFTITLPIPGRYMCKIIGNLVANLHCKDWALFS